MLGCNVAPPLVAAERSMPAKDDSPTHPVQHWAGLSLVSPAIRPIPPTPPNPLVTQDVKCVRWHPQGEVLASASYDDSIKLWVDEDDEWVCAQTLAGAVQKAVAR